MMKILSILIITFFLTAAVANEKSDYKWSMAEMKQAVSSPASLRAFITINAKIQVDELPLALNSAIDFELQPYANGLRQLIHQQNYSKLNDELSLIVTAASDFFSSAQGLDLLDQARYLTKEELTQLQPRPSYSKFKDETALAAKIQSGSAMSFTNRKIGGTMSSHGEQGNLLRSGDSHNIPAHLDPNTLMPVSPDSKRFQTLDDDTKQQIKRFHKSYNERLPSDTLTDDKVKPLREIELDKAVDANNQASAL